MPAQSSEPSPTADFTVSPAMSEEDCLAALNAGAEVIAGADLLVLDAALRAWVGRA